VALFNALLTNYSTPEKTVIKGYLTLYFLGYFTTLNKKGWAKQTQIQCKATNPHLHYVPTQF